MSFNRENVIFQQPNGLWTRAFYAVAAITGPDSEWDVEYDFTRFDWMSTGHRSEEAAAQSWTGSNPGGCTTFTLADDAAECARLWALVCPPAAPAPVKPDYISQHIRATAARHGVKARMDRDYAAAEAAAQQDDLDAMSFAQLMTIAKALKVPGRGTARIDALREGIRAARRAS